MTLPPAVGRALALLLLAAVFCHANRAPVAPFDSWSHLKYGHWISEHRKLPDREPFSPYSNPDVRIYDSCWLGQVLFAAADRRGGLEGVSLLFALLETAKAALMLAAIRRATGSLGTAIGAVTAMELLGLPFFDAVRISAPAEVCCAALLLILAARAPTTADLVAAPVVVALWVNLHWTFLIAYVLIGAVVLGRFLTEVRARRGPSRALREPAVQRLLLVALLSAVAMLVNPYGKNVLSLALHSDPPGPLFARQWGPLVPVQTAPGAVVLGLLVTTLFVIRLSPRRFTVTEVLLLVGFGLGAWLERPLAVWWVMLAPWLLAPHALAMAERFVAWGAWPARAARWLGLSAVATTVFLLALSPAAAWAVGRPLPTERRVGPTVPYRLAEALAAEPGEQRTFCAPLLWGDYLLWRLPPEDRLYWYSHRELFAQRQRDDALIWLVRPASSEARELWDRYRINALVIGPEEKALYDYVRHEGAAHGWVIKAEVGEEAPPGVRGLLAVRVAP